jgi:hypothetical protein
VISPHHLAFVVIYSKKKVYKKTANDKIQINKHDRVTSINNSDQNYL